MKRIILFIFTVLSFGIGFGQTALVSGDIALIGMDTPGEDFMFVTFVDLAAGTEIYFTDEEADGDTTIGTGEGTVLYTAPVGGILAGTVVSYIGNSANFTTTSDGLMALGNSGDGILAYQGPSVSNVNSFLHAIGEDAGDLGTFPGGFTNFMTIGSDDGEYNGARTGLTAAQYLTEINDNSNWTTSGSGVIPFDLTFFSLPAAGCSITSLDLTNVSCDDNSSVPLATDDRITFDLNPTGSGLGANYNITVSSGSLTPTTAAYGSLTSFTMNTGSAGGGNVTVTITDATTGTCTDNVLVTDPGTCSAPPTPTITVAPATLTGLDYVTLTGPSASQSFTVTGTALSASATITAPANFEVSLDDITFTPSVTIGLGIVNGANPVYVRLVSGLAIASYSGNVSVASTGATTQNVAVSGDVTAATSVCISENFDAGTSNPTGWTNNGSYYNSGSSNSPSNKAGMNDVGDWIQLPNIDYPVSMTYYARLSSAESVTNGNRIKVQYFNGTTWDDVIEHTSTGTSYTQYTANLSAYSALTGVQLRLYRSADNRSHYIDDVEVICGAAVSSPEINLQGNATDIPDGNTAISVSDDTDFGDVLVSAGTNPNTFTIQNTGTTDLTITSVTSSNNTEFAVPATSGVITAGNSITFTVTFDPSAIGTRTSTITIVNDDADEASYDFAVEGNGTAVPDIVLSSSNPAVAASNIIEGSDDNIIYAYQLDVTTFDATFTAFDFVTSGSATNGNITNFKAYYSADATLNVGTDVFLDNVTTGKGAGTHTISGFSQTIASGTSAYIFITTDLPCPSTVGNTIIVDAITIADLTFVSGNKTGTAFASGTHTIVDDTPVNITGAGTSACENGGTTVSWTDATGCYDNYIVVASLSSLVTAPSGNGVSYSADAAYGSGTAYDDGFVVYKGTGSTVSITGLTNGTNYTYTIFTRNGTTWSSGVEVDCTPTIAYCTAAATNTSFEFIEGVTLNTINNTSGATTYSDFTAISTTVERGETYTLSVFVGDFYASDSAIAWIDWNADGTFDATEKVLDGFGSAPFTVSITVPLGAALSSTTLRIRLYDSSVGTQNHTPCGTHTYGEVEDYTLTIIDPCTPTHTASSFTPTSGPVGTEVTISGTGFTASTTVDFNGTAATVTFIDATTIIAAVPVGATTGQINIFEAACDIQAGLFTIIDANSTCSSTSNFTDLIISEVYDSDANNVWYVELYNPTSSPIDLDAGDYEIDRYADLTGGSSRTIDLTGVVAPYSVFLLNLGSSSNTCTKTWDFTSGGGGINAEDRNILTKAGVDLDAVHLPNQTGYTVKRLGSATGPTATYDAADWTILTTEDCSDLGVAPVLPTTSPTVSSITDDSDCEIIDLSVTVVEGVGVPSGDITYQWYYTDGMSASWTAVTSALPAGYTILGETSDNLLIESDTNPLDDLNDYQFYCEVVEAGSCDNVSNAEKFEFNNDRYFRSLASGDWNVLTTWEMATSVAGPWSAACTYPTALNSDYISIENGFNVNIPEGIGAPDISADQLIIQEGGELTLAVNAELNIENGAAGSDFEIEGTFIDASTSGLANGTTFNGGATWNITSSGTIIKTNTSSGTSYRDNYETGIANITADANWIYRYDGSGNVTVANSAGGSPMFYPILTYESTSGNYDFDAFSEAFTGYLERVTIKGDLNIGVSGGNVKVFNNNFNSSPILIKGDLYIGAGSELTNEAYTTINGNYDVQWREGSGFELEGDALIEGVFDLSHSASLSYLNTLGRITPGLEVVIFSKTGTVQSIIGDAAESFITQNATVNTISNVKLTDVDLVIDSLLTFSTGKIITDVVNNPSDKVVVNNILTTAIVNGVTSGSSLYVEGKLQWKTDGTSTYTFPVGFATPYGAQGFTIDLTGATGADILTYLETNNTSPIQSFAYCDMETPNGGSGQIGSGTGTPDGILDQIEFNLESDLQWDITNPNGGITSYDLVVLANGAQDISPISSSNGTAIRYLMKNGQPGNPTVPTTTGAPAFNATGFNACPNQYTLNGLTSFSKFTLNGATVTNTTLPVELLYFKATIVGDHEVLTSWSTVTEINNDFFTVERSIDGNKFEALGVVQGAGNYSGKKDYQFPDKEAYDGVSYYRLKQTDYDGTTSYSEIISVNFKSTVNDDSNFSVYPIPFTNNITVKVSNDEEVNAVVYDLSGKLILQTTFRNTKTMDLSNLASGTYFINLKTNSKSENIKLVKN